MLAWVTPRLATPGGTRIAPESRHAAGCRTAHPAVKSTTGKSCQGHRIRRAKNLAHPPSPVGRAGTLDGVPWLVIADSLDQLRVSCYGAECPRCNDVFPLSKFKRPSGAKLGATGISTSRLEACALRYSRC